jgi:hypothetical protein
MSTEKVNLEENLKQIEKEELIDNKAEFKDIKKDDENIKEADEKSCKVQINPTKINEVSSISIQKKASPFLSSEIKKESVGDEENSSTKRQHDQIDKVSKSRSIFNATGKLYFKSEKTGKMETRGEGKFLILKDDGNMHKLLMIRDLVMLKGCNHVISPVCPLTKATQAKNSWIWTAMHDQSDAEKNEEKTLYFASFKDEETSNLFEKKYKEAQEMNLKELKSKKDLINSFN